MTKPFTAFVCASAIIVHQGKILLLEENRVGKRQLNCPGGRVKPTETPMDAVRREVKEETGLEVEIASLAAVTEGIWSDGGQFAKFIFEAKKTGGVESAVKDTRLHWLSPYQILNSHLFDPPILDIDKAVLVEYLTAPKRVSPFFFEHGDGEFRRATF